MRKTKNEIIKLQQAGFYIDVDLPDAPRDLTDIQKAKDKETGFSDLNDDRYTLYECHVDLTSATQTGGFNDSIDITVNHRVDVIYPSGTFLANTWGSVTIA